MRRPNIYYANLGLPAPDANEFEGALGELPSVLSDKPLRADITVTPLPDRMMKRLMPLLDTRDRALHEVNTDVYREFCRLRVREHLLAIACPRSHQLLWAKTTQGTWGTAFPGGPLAVCWTVPDKFIVWHEALHLLGADDCYDLETHRATCELPHCIMQFEPTANTVRSRPFLCKKVLDRLRTCLQIRTE